MSVVDGFQNDEFMVKRWIAIYPRRYVSRPTLASFMNAEDAM